MMRSLCLLALFAAVPAFAAEPEVNRKLLKPGLIAGFVADTGTTHRLDPTVAFYLKAGEGATPFGLTREVKWSGYIQIVTAGAYQFAAVYQGGTPAVTLARGDQTYTGFSLPKGDTAKEVIGQPTQLEPGVYRFAATFACDAAAKEDRRFELQWRGPGFNREPIPNFFLGHLPEQRKDTVDKSLPVEAGRFLFEEYGCKNCHHPKADDAIGKGLINRTGPDLSEVGKRVYPGWLDAWLADPTKLRSQTTMPKLFGDDDVGRAERYAVEQYLTALGGPLAAAKAPTISNEWSKSIDKGQKLFTLAGCAACHGKQLAATAKKNEDDDDDKPVKLEPSSSVYGLGSETGAQGLYALGGVGSKTTPDQLQKFLLDPLKTNPHGRMPNMQLSNDEARDLARFLNRSTDEHFDKMQVPMPKLTPKDIGGENDSWADVGKKLVTTKGCVNCHTLTVKGANLPASQSAPSLKVPTVVEESRVPGKLGCLADNPDPKKVPQFPLSEERRAALRAFVKDGLRPSVPASVYEARTALKRFNCLNCHTRDGEGGIGTDLGDQMKKLETAENADDVTPPRLGGVGHKAKTSWLEAVLLNSGRARPWMTLRMPQYGSQNVGHLPVGLAHLEATVPDSSSRKVDYTQEKLEVGRKLSGSEGLGCIKCHDISGHVGGGTRGPDLARTAERLRFDWYERWMHNPQRLAPGTKMPQNFNNGKSAYDKVMKGEADPQIEAIWAYLSLGPGLPLPIGMEPPKGLVLKGGARPEILRTFMPDGAGNKAIAVGFPGVSYVFDADACRVAYAWEGNFLDASPVWNNRGGAPAKLLGPKFLTPPTGQPWAVTTSRMPPDFEKRAKDFSFGAPVPNEQIYQGKRHVQFEGYSLSADGVPSFRYRVGEPNEKGDLRVTETITPAKGGVATGLTRAFALEAPAAKSAWLWAGETKDAPRYIGPDGTSRPILIQNNVVEHEAVGSKVVLPAGGRATVLIVTAAPKGAVWRFDPMPGGRWFVYLRLPEGKEAAKVDVAFTAWAVPKDDDAIIGAVGK